MKSNYLFFYLFFTVLLGACSKDDCDNANLAPGRYSDECACPDGGVNFHGDCIPNTAKVFTGEYTGHCKTSFAIAIDYEKNESCDYQFSEEVDAFVYKKSGPFTEEGKYINSNITCSESFETETIITYYSYYLPSRDATEIEVRFDTRERATFDLTDSYTIVMKQI